MLFPDTNTLRQKSNPRVWGWQLRHQAYSPKSGRNAQEVRLKRFRRTWEGLPGHDPGAKAEYERVEVRHRERCARKLHWGRHARNHARHWTHRVDNTHRCFFASLSLDFRAARVIARWLIAIDATMCPMASMAHRVPPPSVVSAHNVLYGALPLARFLLLRPDHGRAALRTRCRRASCELPPLLGLWLMPQLPPNTRVAFCRNVLVSEEHALTYMLLVAGVTGRSHDNQRASPLFVANAGCCRCGA